MAIAQSKLTSQSQISVPAEVRKRLGIGPGSILEWHDEDGNVVVRKAGRFSSSEIHEVLFAEDSAKGRKLPEVKAAIRKYIRQRHARR